MNTANFIAKNIDYFTKQIVFPSISIVNLLAEAISRL
jgi:hypothetical protein